MLGGCSRHSLPASGNRNRADENPWHIAPNLVRYAPRRGRFLVDHNDRQCAATSKRVSGKCGPRGPGQRLFDRNPPRLKNGPEYIGGIGKFVHDEDALSTRHVAILPWIALPPVREAEE